MVIAVVISNVYIALTLIMSIPYPFFSKPVLVSAQGHGEAPMVRFEASLTALGPMG